MMLKRAWWAFKAREGHIFFLVAFCTILVGVAYYDATGKIVLVIGGVLLVGFALGFIGFRLKYQERVQSLEDRIALVTRIQAETDQIYQETLQRKAGLDQLAMIAAGLANEKVDAFEEARDVDDRH